MTPEQRLDRLERIAKLFVKAGLPARRELRGHNNKINHLIDLQINNEERFDKLAESHANLAKSQADTNRRLDSLIDILRDGRNGDSRPSVQLAP
jgi:hypothetical protein